VNRYVTTNGFDAVPRMSSRSAKPRKDRRDRSLDDSELLSLDGDTTSSSSSDNDDDDDASESDASRHRRSPPRRQHQQGMRNSLGRAGTRRQHMAVRRPDPFPYSGSHFYFGSERAGLPSPIPYRPPVGLPPQRPLPSPLAGNKPLLPPPPPPPPPPPHPSMLLHTLHAPQPPPAPTLTHRLHALPPRVEVASPSPAASPNTVARPGRTGVLLCVVWLGHGSLDVLDDCPLSVSCIQKRAQQLVRTRQFDFQDAESVDFASVVPRAKIKRLHVAGTVYELGSFQDDLGELFASFPNFPRVEVEVTSTPVSPTKVPPSSSSS
jgi:hypothetical protein